MIDKKFGLLMAGLGITLTATGVVNGIKTIYAESDSHMVKEVNKAAHLNSKTKPKVTAPRYAPHAFTLDYKDGIRYVHSDHTHRTYYVDPQNGRLHDLAKPTKAINIKKQRSVGSKIASKITYLTGASTHNTLYDFTYSKDKKSVLVTQSHLYKTTESVMNRFRVTNKHVYLIGYLTGKEYLID